MSARAGGAGASSIAQGAIKGVSDTHLVVRAPDSLITHVSPVSAFRLIDDSKDLPCFYAALSDRICPSQVAACQSTSPTLCEDGLLRKFSARD